MELNNIKSNVPLPIGPNLIYEQLNSDAKYQNVILNAIQDISVQQHWAERARILLLQTLSTHNLSVKMSNNFNLKLFIG